MSTKNIYSRKISSKEAKEGFIFILKNKLPFFPALKNNFILEEEDLPQEVRVDSYPCTCRGPDRPHEHYFIPWKGLEAGNKIEITKSDYNEDKYLIKIYKS
jgi:hypothetical protein